MYAAVQEKTRREREKRGEKEKKKVKQIKLLKALRLPTQIQVVVKREEKRVNVNQAAFLWHTL